MAVADPNVIEESSVSYEGEVEQGIALARAGQIEEAQRAFSRAILLEPRRADAWRERGAMYFRGKKYVEAARDLDAAIARENDTDTRRLLGAALHLADRAKAALRVWNAMGEPRLRALHFTGLMHTRPTLVRGEMPLTEGKLLSLRRLEETELRFRELGAFDRIALRSVPWGDGTADLNVALVERRGLAGSKSEFAVQTIANLLSERIELHYANLQGRGLELRGRYRWRRAQPELSLACDWPRFLGLDAKTSIRVFRGRQRYELADMIVSRSRGFDLEFRHVIDGRTLARAGFGYRARRYDGVHVLARPGEYGSVSLGLKRHVVATRFLDLSVDGLVTKNAGRSNSFLRSALTFEGGIRWRQNGDSVDLPSMAAVRIQMGTATRRTPLDELARLGGGSDAEWPLRAHRQTRDGVLGITPLAQHVCLGNIELRQGLFQRSFMRVGIVLAYSPAFLDGIVTGRQVRYQYQDVGIGFRVAGLLGVRLRADLGFGILDGQKSLFLGLNEWF